MIRKRETAAFRDQQADAMGSVNDTVDCADDECDSAETWKTIKESDDWQVSNDPQLPLLCPSCADRTSDETCTPTEARHESNRSLGEYSRTGDTDTDQPRTDGGVSTCENPEADCHREPTREVSWGEDITSETPRVDVRLCDPCAKILERGTVISPNELDIGHPADAAANGGASDR